MQKLRLRERGIYELPDGKQFVVCGVKGGGWNLYEPRYWHSFAAVAEYRAYPDGRIFWKDSPTPWAIIDLIDTGRTAEFLYTASEPEGQSSDGTRYESDGR
jgi:hypothetical protein